MPGASVTILPLPEPSLTPQPGASGAGTCLNGIITVIVGGNAYQDNNTLCPVTGTTQSITRRHK